MDSLNDGFLARSAQSLAGLTRHRAGIRQADIRQADIRLTEDPTD
jgi:hypothetical protein